MFRFLRSGLVTFLACLFLALPAIAAPVEWRGGFANALNASSPKLPDGSPYTHLRYRGKAGDIVAVMLSGIVRGAEGKVDPRPAAKIVLEYNTGGDAGEWKTANLKDGAFAFQTKAPEKGTVDIRVRGTKSNVTEDYGLELFARTEIEGASPVFLVAMEIKDKLPTGEAKILPLSFPQGGTFMELEIRAEDFIPDVRLDNPDGSFVDFKGLVSGPRIKHTRYTVATAGDYRVRVNSGSTGRTGGSFLLRCWLPAELERQ